MSVSVQEQGKRVQESKDTHATPAHTQKPVSAEECAKASEPHPREKLPAEKMFDQWAYGGISYAGQAGTGILLTHWIREGGGRKYFDRLAEWAGKAFVGKITGKSGVAAAKEADSWIVVSTMIMVGNAFLLPLKWLENRKPQIVRGMTKNDNAKREARGETVTPEENQRQQELLDQLDHAPKQTWPSLLLGRGFGLGAVYATLWAIGQKKNEWGEAQFAQTVSKTLDKAGMKSLAKSKTTEIYSRIAFYDLFYSMVSAGGLYVYSHFLHPEKVNNDVVRDAPPKECLKQQGATSALQENGDTKPAKQKASENEAISSAHTAQVKRENASFVASRSQPETYAEKIRDTARGTELVLGV